MNATKKISIETIERSQELERIGNAAVKKAQEENRRLGIPNWYSVNGKIISDQQIEQLEAEKEKK